MAAKVDENKKDVVDWILWEYCIVHNCHCIGHLLSFERMQLRQTDFQKEITKKKLIQKYQAANHFAGPNQMRSLLQCLCVQCACNMHNSICVCVCVCKKYYTIIWYLHECSTIELEHALLLYFSSENIEKRNSQTHMQIYCYTEKPVNFNRWNMNGQTSEYNNNNNRSHMAETMNAKAKNKKQQHNLLTYRY